MIDLSGLGRAFKSTQKADKPTVSAIVVMDSGNESHMDSVRKALTQNGFSVENVTKNDDGSLVFAQDSTPLDNTSLVRLSSNMMVALKGFDSYSQDLSDNADFDDTVAASGFYNGLNTAIDALYSTLSSIMSGTDSSDSAGTDVATTLSKFSAYIQALVKGLPSNAFKADQALQSIAKKREAVARKSADDKNIDLENLPDDAPEGITQNDWDSLDDLGKVQWLKDSTNSPSDGETQKKDGMTTAATKADISNNTILALVDFLKQAPSGSDGTAWAAMSDGDKLAWYASSYNKANDQGAQDGTDIPGAAVPIPAQNPTASVKADVGTGSDAARATKVEQDIAALATALSKLAETVGTVVAKLDTQNKTLTAQIGEISRKSEITSNKVASVVIAPASAGDAPSGRVQSIAKSESSDPRTGSFDTAFIRKAERNRR